MRVLTERSKFFYVRESEFQQYGISDPFFLFCWPGGQALSRFILDNRGLVEGKRVLVMGIGCGVEGIAAILAGAEYVLGSDIDVNALIMSTINMELNNVKYCLIDKDFVMSDCKDFDVVLAGDIFYDNEVIQPMVAWFRKLKGKDKLILCADPFRGRINPGEIESLGEYDVIKDGEILSGIKIKCRVFTIKYFKEILKYIILTI